MNNCKCNRQEIIDPFNSGWCDCDRAVNEIVIEVREAFTAQNQLSKNQKEVAHEVVNSD